MMLLISLGSLSSGSDRGLLILHLVICGLQPTCNLQADATAGAGLALHKGGGGGGGRCSHQEECCGQRKGWFHIKKRGL